LKKLLLVLLILLLAFAIINRQRLYVRDPLGSVTRAGTPEPGAQVYINYANDVLLQNDNPPRYATLIQHGQPAGAPARITCLHWLACLTEAEHPPLVGKLAPADTMTNKLVNFRDADGREAVVSLR
jgi:hypothetical protein